MASDMVSPALEVTHHCQFLEGEVGNHRLLVELEARHTGRGCADPSEDP